MSKEKKERSLFHKSVNGFIIFLVVILALFTIFFGFSQTKTFRDYLKDQIVENVNSSINGQFTIDRIEGSIFTSLRIYDITLESGFDTVVTVGRIEVNINPVQILLKKIYLRSVVINDLDFNLREVEKKTWNLGSLFSSDSISTPDSAHSTPTDSASSGGFPFIIQANDIQLKNVNFSVKSFENLKRNRSYRFANYDDLVISGLDLRAKAQVNPTDNEYQLILNSLSFDINVDRFKLRNLSGAFQISEELVTVRKLNILTDSTNLSLDVSIHGLNLLDNLVYSDFSDYPTELSLTAEPFTFSDLNVFVPNTDMLKGAVNLDMRAGGLYGNLLIDKLIADYNSAHLNLSGEVKNLHTPENLYLDMQFKNSNLSIRDAASLLPELDLPKYQTMDLNNFNLTYKGTPTKFKSSFSGNVNRGFLKFNSNLNFSTPLINYTVDFNTDNLDISELVNSSSILNSKGRLQGKGVDPTKISAKLVVDSYKSKYNGYNIDSLHLDIDAKAKVFQLDLNGLINKATTAISGKLDLTDQENPVYDLTGSVNNLDLAKFDVDTSYISLLNFKFKSDGEGLDLDEMVGQFDLEFDQSIFKTTFFEDASINLTLRKDENFREINLKSDFLDCSVSGEFSLQDAVELLSYQAEQTSTIISDKINELDVINRTDSSEINQQITVIDTSIVNKQLEFDYEFEFKDFELIALIIGEEELGIAGTGGGSVKNDSSNFAINTNLSLDYFYTLNKDEILYLSNLESDLNFSKNNQSVSFDNLFGAISVSSDRIVAGSIVKNFTADFVFNQSKLIYNVFTEIDTFLTSSFAGKMEMRPGNQKLEIEEAEIDYKDSSWTNREPIQIDFSPDSVMFRSFRLYNGSAFVDVSGLFTSIGAIDMLIKADKIPGSLLSYYTLGQAETGFMSETKLATKINGNITDPRVSVDFRINDITINEKNLGSLYCLAGYYKKNFEINFKLIDSTYNLVHPYFQLSGNVPVNLTPSENEKVINPSKKLDLQFKANKFDLATFGNILPAISNQSGLLSGNISFSGSFDEIRSNGSLTLKQMQFLSDFNNLQYRAGFKLDFRNDVVYVDSLSLSNHVGSKIQGTINGTGYARLNGFTPDFISLTFGGGLGVLGKRSKTTSKQIFGNLFVQAKDSLRYTYDNGKNNFTGSVLLRDVDITFSPLQSGYSANNSIVYDIKVDSSKIDKEKLKFDKLVAGNKNKNNLRNNSNLSDFDYTVNVEIDNQAKIDFILSPAFNQKLSVLASGKMRYASIDGQPQAQGEFDLLDGSKLEFFKVFDAEGSIRFETKVADPYLDILATYTTDWYQDENTPTPVAVKINIAGNFSELGRNLSSSTDNIQVYIGSNNINNSIPDVRYDAKNALSFILVGKPDFVGSNEGTGNFASDLATETSFSILGSALTSLVNSRVGDAINDIKLSKSSGETRFNVSGKIENIRYTVGLTQNIGPTSSSNNFDTQLRVEYLFNPNFLIRLERKPPLNTSSSTENINELGLKYIFEF